MCGGVTVKKIRIGAGAFLMALTALISDKMSLILIYAASAFLHEAGHLCAARLLKIRVREIRFGFAGVRICTEPGLSSYRDEFLLAAAGPFVNLLIIVVALTLSGACGAGVDELLALTAEFAEGGELRPMGALGFAALSSLLQGGMNLLPIDTYDGGRMLYCGAATLLGEERAQRLISVTSAASAFILWTAALYLMLKISAGLGIYVFSVCIFLSVLKDTEIVGGKNISRPND